MKRRLRHQAKRWHAAQRATRHKFECRLDRVARNVPRDFINTSVEDVRRRCELLYEAKGGLFEEGGKTRRPL